MPRVSVGLPVYNGEWFLNDLLDSLLDQTYRDFELIICDNASDDRTQEICESYVSKNRHFRYYRNGKNLGAAHNFNRTLQLSSGEYFKWVACDDVYASTHLEKCLEILDQEPAVVLSYPKTIIIDEKGKKYVITRIGSIYVLRCPTSVCVNSCANLLDVIQFMA